MAKIPAFRKIIIEQFPEVKWISRLAFPLNRFIEEVSRALKNGLTVSENMDGAVKQFTTEGSYPIKLAWTNVNRPKLCIIGKIEKADGSDPSLTSAVTLDWAFNGQELVINNVMGITPSSSSKFVITIMALAG